MAKQKRLDDLGNFIDKLPSEDGYVVYDINGDPFFIYEKSLVTIYKWKDIAQSEILEIQLSGRFPKT
jgi:hypothetical protein